MDSFGHRLDKAMIRADVRADVLAYLMGVPLLTVVRWLRQQPPPDVQTVLRLCAVLRVSPFELVPDFDLLF